MNTLYVTSLLRDVGQIGLVEEYTNYNHSCIQTLNKGRFIVGRAMEILTRDHEKTQFLGLSLRIVCKISIVMCKISDRPSRNRL